MYIIIDGMDYTRVGVYTQDSKYPAMIRSNLNKKGIKTHIIDTGVLIEVYLSYKDLVNYLRKSRKYRGLDYMKGVFYAVHYMLGESGYLAEADGTVIQIS